MHARNTGVVDMPCEVNLVIVGDHFDGFFRGAGLNCKSTRNRIVNPLALFNTTGCFNGKEKKDS